MRLILAAAFCAIIGCTVSSPTSDDNRQGPGEVKKHEDSAQRQHLLEIAETYKSYKKIDDSFRFGPQFCQALGTGNEYHLSRSADENTHGRKLYLLYAAKFDYLVQSYADRAVIDHEKSTDKITYSKLQPINGQVIVKESWLAEEIKAGDQISDQIALGPMGKKYRPGAKGPLFVMYQTDPKDPNSDDGWVYGTLTPDGKTLTGVGRLENCMSCHQKAPHGRLFGLPRD